MKISKKSDYALILASIIAQNQGDVYLPLDKISEKYRLPLPFLKQIAGNLIKANILKSREGAGGGYKLKENASKIMIGDVIRAVEGGVRLTACAKDGNRSCKREDFCPSKTVWRKFWLDLVTKLDTTSLAEIDSL